MGEGGLNTHGSVYEHVGIYSVLSGFVPNIGAPPPAPSFPHPHPPSDQHAFNICLRHISISSLII